MPDTTDLVALGLILDDPEDSSVIASDGKEQADTLARYRQTALASCSTMGLTVVVTRFETAQVAAKELATSLRTSPNSDDPQSMTVPVPEIPGATMVANPEFGTAGVYWLSQPNTVVSVTSNYDFVAIEGADVRPALVSAAVEIDQRIRRGDSG